MNDDANSTQQPTTGEDVEIGPAAEADTSRRAPADEPETEAHTFRYAPGQQPEKETQNFRY